MKLRVFIGIFVIGILSSCAVSHNKNVECKQKKIRRLSDAKLYDEIVANYLEFGTINFKKVSISYEQDGKKQDFRGSVRILKDSIVWLSISKMGIEGMRAKLTPDSVIIIDRLHREYLQTDYAYLNKKLNIEMDFTLVQNLLTNRLLDYRVAGDLPFTKKFRGKRTDTNYVLVSKRRRYKKYWKEQAYITGNVGSTTQTLYISPDLMRLEKMEIFDMQYPEFERPQQVVFNLQYLNYQKYEDDYLLPQNIVAKINKMNGLTSHNTAAEEHTISLQIKIDKVEVNPADLRFPFSISKKYKRIDG